MGVFDDTLRDLVTNAERRLGRPVLVAWTYDAHAPEAARWIVTTYPGRESWTAATGIAALQFAAAHYHAGG